MHTLPFIKDSSFHQEYSCQYKIACFHIDLNDVPWHALCEEKLDERSQESHHFSILSHGYAHVKSASFYIRLAWS
jgi:hypothetical protein